MKSSRRLLANSVIGMKWGWSALCISSYIAAGGTSPDQGFDGSKNLQRQQHLVGVSRVLGTNIRGFLREVYLLNSLTLSKGRDSNQFWWNSQIIPSSQIQEKQHFTFLNYTNFPFGRTLNIILHMPRKKTLHVPQSMHRHPSPPPPPLW